MALNHFWVLVMSESVTPPSLRPLLASCCLLVLGFALVDTIKQGWYGPWLLAVSAGLLLWVIAGWFADAIRDEAHNSPSENAKSNQAYRWSFGWFVFTELCLFLTFFSALFYIRWVIIPWLSGHGGHEKSLLTHRLIWPEFAGTWPLLEVPDSSKYTAPELAMVAWGVPTINTAILLLSGVTITISHHFLLHNRTSNSLTFLVITVLLGWLFLGLQAWEYIEAYTHLGLTFSSGVYGNLFYLLTGFHGLHVFLGTVILATVAVRMYTGGVHTGNAFAFEASSWYWHFVDVVWLFLFVFVYWL